MQQNYSYIGFYNSIHTFFFDDEKSAKVGRINYDLLWNCCSDWRFDRGRATSNIWRIVHSRPGGNLCILAIIFLILANKIVVPVNVVGQIFRN
jgi:hypothetical protein